MEKTIRNDSNKISILFGENEILRALKLPFCLDIAELHMST